MYGSTGRTVLLGDFKEIYVDIWVVESEKVRKGHDKFEVNNDPMKDLNRE